MHMADALVSPAVGGLFWVASGYLTSKSSIVLKKRNDTGDTALMGVLAAFVFAAQMIDFYIPGTGSSGHVVGGLLLAILLGPERAFLSMVSILAVQALFFADGGLLAMGCNIFNMAFFSCFLAYPLIYKKLIAKIKGDKGIFWGATIASTAGLLMGAFFVVLQTTLSGITSLPFGSFMLLMLPIHFAIGVVEGIATALVVIYVRARMPEVFVERSHLGRKRDMKRAVTTFAVLAVMVGGVFAWYASSSPDGLEWSLESITGSAELEEGDTFFHGLASSLQEKIAPMPDYSFKDDISSENVATTVSGLVGSIVTLLIAFAVGNILRGRKENT